MTGATLSQAKGSSGPDVTEWQQLLTAAGFSVPITGIFDDATTSATKAWQKSKGLVADGIVGPASQSAMTGKTPPGTTDKNAKFGRDALLAAWTKVTGETPNLAELQISGAQAHLESNYGKSVYKLLNHADGSVLATSGVINNWGAVQTSEGPPGGFLATDTSPNKVTADNPKGYYDHHYKVYPTPEAGAEHFVKHMTVLRPTSWALMKTGDIDAWARQMHSYNPPGSKTLNPDPITGTFGYFEQHPDSRAKGIEQRIANIAFTLGEPVAARRGGPMPSAEEGEGFGVPAPVGTQAAARTGLLALLLAALGYGAYRIWGPK